MQRAFWLSLCLWCSLSTGALAFQVQVRQAQVTLRSQADARQGKALQRIKAQQAQLLNTSHASDGELWCYIRPQQGPPGWLPARFVDPILTQNKPLALTELPAELVFNHAQHQLIYQQNLKDPRLKNQLQKALLEMELAMIKQSWEVSRQRRSFLDISRRIGIQISKSEYQGLQQQELVLEQQYKRTLASWLHL